MPDDALDVSKMNVNPGGKQRVMRDGVWKGRPQSMNFVLGVPKGMRHVLEERGIDTRGMKADDVCLVLGNHQDFKGEKSSVERFLTEERGHIVYMLLSSTVNLIQSNVCGHNLNYTPRLL